MNQFKKAKQKALESGHQVENIKDLQTAGVKITLEEEKSIETPKEIVTTPTPIVEPIIESTTPTEEPQQIVSNAIVVETPATPEPEPTPIKVEIPLVESPAITVQEPVYEEIKITPEPIVAPQVAATIPIPVRVAPAPVAQDDTYTTPVVTAPKPSATKKNVPNIFAPKNEAKSMRKSLVLKPTSVKIAENYCAKNGGSFNELIQTLLDNFIDEYGL